MQCTCQTKLTRVEESIVKAVVAGLSNHEISQKLKIKEPTLKNYVAKILSKMGLNTRYELMAKYRSLDPVRLEGL